jgi:hypothetical protein
MRSLRRRLCCGGREGSKVKRKEKDVFSILLKFLYDFRQMCVIFATGKLKMALLIKYIFVSLQKNTQNEMSEMFM